MISVRPRVWTSRGLQYLFVVTILQNVKEVQSYTIVVCPTYWFMSNGSCRPCPPNCRACVSETSCTLCEKGFYGQVCEHNCGKQCKGTCHKVYGHCTYGCPDSDYPADDDSCRRCPDQCTLCESQSKCVLCKDGQFGEACHKRCPEHCIRCNKTSGECLQCKNSYFPRRGQCNSCSIGCRSCATDTNCSHCLNSYFLHDGQCKHCLHGCKACNTTGICQTCEEGFHGPVYGHCLFKCPGNDVITYKVPDKDGRCGIWQDTNTNICDGESERHNCMSSGNCLQAMPCLASAKCVTDTETPTSCALVRTYHCKHKCQKIDTSYVCVTNCTVHTRESEDTSLLCLNNGTRFIDAQPFKNNDGMHCNQEKDNGFQQYDGTLQNSALLIISIVNNALIVVIIFVALFICLRNRLTRKKRSKDGALIRQTTSSILLKECVRCELNCTIGDCSEEHSGFQLSVRNIKSRRSSREPTGFGIMR